MKLLAAVNPETAKTWVNGLQGKSREEILVGLRKAADFTGYFSLPAFRELCRVTAKDLGLPDIQLAYKESCDYQHPTTRKPFTHPALHWITQQTGNHELKSQPTEKVMPRYKKFYEEAVNRINNGEVFTVPEHKQIEHAPKVVADEDSPARKRFLEMKANLRSELIGKGLIKN